MSGSNHSCRRDAAGLILALGVGEFRNALGLAALPEFANGCSSRSTANRIRNTTFFGVGDLECRPVSLLLLLIHPHPVKRHALWKELEIVKFILPFFVGARIIWTPYAEVVATDGLVKNQEERIFVVDLSTSELCFVCQIKARSPFLAVEHEDDLSFRPFTAVDVVVLRIGIFTRPGLHRTIQHLVRHPLFRIDRAVEASVMGIPADVADRPVVLALVIDRTCVIQARRAA